MNGRLNQIREMQQEESRTKRENDVVLHGIPQNSTTEEPIEILALLEKVFNYPLTARGVFACSRLRSKDPDAQPLLIKFSTWDEKAKFMDHAEKNPIFASSFGGPKWKKIFVNEHLTKKAADLFRAALKLRDAGVAKVWTKRGHVFMKRRALGAHSIEVISKMQIERMKRVTGSFERSNELYDINVQ